MVIVIYSLQQGGRLFLPREEVVPMEYIAVIVIFSFYIIVLLTKKK